jgi:hypothetical protein
VLNIAYEFNDSNAYLLSLEIFDELIYLMLMI